MRAYYEDVKCRDIRACPVLVINEHRHRYGPLMSIPADRPLATAPSSTPDAYRTFGIVGFVLSFFVILNLAGLAISIIALVGSRRQGHRNGLALAGVVIAGAGVAVTLVIVFVLGATVVDAGQTCARLGEGVHTAGPATYTCGPGSFYVRYGG